MYTEVDFPWKITSQESGLKVLQVKPDCMTAYIDIYIYMYCIAYGCICLSTIGSVETSIGVDKGKAMVEIDLQPIGRWQYWNIWAESPDPVRIVYLYMHMYIYIYTYTWARLYLPAVCMLGRPRQAKEVVKLVYYMFILLHQLISSWFKSY